MPWPTTISASSCRPRVSSTRRSPNTAGHRDQARPGRGTSQPRRSPWAQGNSTRPSPNTARRSDSSPTTPMPTTTSATPWVQGKLDEAIAEYRTRDPTQARLCRSPHQPRLRPGGPGQARRGDRRISRRDPTQARPRRGPQQPRASRCTAQGKLDEAIAEYRRPSDSSPTTPRPTTISASPCVPGEARPGHRRIPARHRDQARLCLARSSLGLALKTQGLFSKAWQSWTRPRVGSQQPGWRYPTEQWVRECRRLVEPDARLPALLGGECRSRTPTSGLCSRTSATRSRSTPPRPGSGMRRSRTGPCWRRTSTRATATMPPAPRLCPAVERQGRPAARRRRAGVAPEAGPRLAEGRPGRLDQSR